MLIVFLPLGKTTRLQRSDEALRKIAELMAYAIFFNHLLLLAEVVKEFYSHTEHLINFRYYFFGIGDKQALVPFAWTALTMGLVAFLIFIIPATRKKFVTMNIGCVLILISVYIEKGMGLVIPGFVPDTLGEIYEYSPTMTELLVSIGIWATGALMFTLMTKVAIPISLVEFRYGKVLEQERNRQNVNGGTAL